MTIINRTRNLVLSGNIKEVQTHQEKKQGLIGSDGATGLFMKTRSGVHTFGMSFPIDLIILDKKNRVVKYKRSLKPNQIIFWNPLYNKVVEIPTALLPKGIVQIGDEMSFFDQHE